MNLVGDDEGQLIHPGSPMSKERVGFLVCRYDDVVSSEPRVRTIIIPGGHSDVQVFAAWFLYVGVALKLLELLTREGAQGSQIDRFSISLKDMLENANLSDEGLATRGGTSENEVLPVENPSLYRVLLGRI